ncbi:uncharacterized protein TNCV_3116991 [Trichonephila clavipes]|nr:uncharacterized protein TNCV_3116991 [Trichonephila clavipes]
MSKGIKSDGKKYFGTGRLTLKEVDSIQHYYGLAIRKNLSSVEDVKRAIWAIYFHKLSTEDNPQHALCPLEKDLLKKCLHGRTQNPNESFNKCIWERIPKTVFVGIETLKFGVMDAVICFNDGYVAHSDTTTAQRYTADILRPVALPFLLLYRELTFQHNNAQPHTARVATNCLQAFFVLPWIARLPDLSPTLWEGHHLGTLSVYATPGDSLHPGQRWVSVLLTSSLCNDQTVK